LELALRHGALRERIAALAGLVLERALRAARR